MSRKSTHTLLWIHWLYCQEISKEIHSIFSPGSYCVIGIQWLCRGKAEGLVSESACCVAATTLKGTICFYFPSAALWWSSQERGLPWSTQLPAGPSVLGTGEAIPLTEPLVSPRITMGSLSLHPQPSPVEMGASLITRIQVSRLQGVRSRGCSKGWPVAHPRSLETNGRAAETCQLPVVEPAASPVPICRGLSDFFLLLG